MKSVNVLPSLPSHAVARYFMLWLWCLIVAGSSLLVVFRTIIHSSVAGLFELRDVPILWFINENYSWIAAGLIGVSLLWLGLIGRTPSSSQRSGLELRAPGFAVVTFLIPSAWTNWSTSWNSTEFNRLQPVGVIDWGLILIVIAIGLWLTVQTVRQVMPPELRVGWSTAGGWAARLARANLVFLFGLTGILSYAVFDHWQFWDPERNGGYDFEQFFLPGERVAADRVMYSTSLLFGSLAAGFGVLAYGIRLLTVPREEATASAERRGLVLLSLSVAAMWTLALTVPWQARLLNEIRAESGWIMPAITIGGLFSGMAPLAALTLSLLVVDRSSPVDGSTTCRTSPGWLIAIGSVLFPVYPLLRYTLPRRTGLRNGLVWLISAAVVAALLVTVLQVEEWFEFEDWRGMLKKGLLPFLQVLLSLLASGLAYILIEPVCGRWKTLPVVRSALGVVGVVCLTGCSALVLFGATWPFWGWRNVPENVFARLYEFNDRYEFELTFLHWLTDHDADGYSGVLHGADPDDNDATVTAGGFPAGEPVPVVADRFIVRADSDSPRASARTDSSHVLVLFLEGITPRAISAYGQRRLSQGRVATPAIDSVAAEGTRFTNARCFYPSTWDAWFAVLCGRYLHISEMNNAQAFGDRYSRYNALYEVLELAGIDRWCHADCKPFRDLFVPVPMQVNPRSNWRPETDDYSTELTAAEQEQGWWRGDKRSQRIVEFIEDIQPGERFFIVEHMSDTHFPWERTSLERAQELGFDEGLDVFEEDAILPSGGTSGTYARYLQTVTRMDGQVGQILDALKRRDLYDDTLIVIVSDHGCQWWEHEHMYYVGHLYDPALRVPMIVRLPGGRPARANDLPVLQIDLLPTLMDWFGVEHVNRDQAGALPGQSLLPILEGQPVDARRFQRRDVPLMTHYDTLGLIHDFETKLIFDRPSGTSLLFDLEADPGERLNLADSQPELLAEMLERLKAFTSEHPAFLGEIQRSQ